MRARDRYELQQTPAPLHGRWRRRLGQLLMLAVDLGPVPGGGGRTLIVETATGAVIGDVKQPFGDDFYDSRLEEDLLTLSVDDFEAKWLASPGS